MDRAGSTLSVPEADGFIWAAGIEDTFISRPDPATGRMLDEYALTQHYDRWPEDLSLLASLGVQAARYGVPWYRVCPARGRYDWSWTDRVLDTMVNTHHVEPIVDLVHYGTPTWLERSFADPDYPNHVAGFAHAFAEHYRGLCAWYTPLNEPRINAWYAGRLGWWPPYGRSWRGFVRVLLHLCRGICLTQHAVAEACPGAVFVHVDATDLYVPVPDTDEGLAQEALTRQQIVFLPLDLVTGRVAAKHPLIAWFQSNGATDDDLAWFAEHGVEPHIVGINMYPMYSRKLVLRTPRGGIRVRIRRCWTDTLATLIRAYADRYSPIPLMVTETANRGSAAARERWILDSAATVAEARCHGHRVVGYTYWPLYSLVAWAWQRSTADVDRHLLHMGLWDLRQGPDGLSRLPTSAVEAYRSVVARGSPVAR